jgi:pyridoxine 5-phosphate synthase
VCLVPEKREELTTEGGLDVLALEKTLTPYIKKLQDNGSRVSLFIAPNKAQVESAKRTDAKVVELHTGTYAEDPSRANLKAIKSAATHAYNLGLEVHAGHGLNYENVGNIAAISEIVELNIGHFLIGEAVFIGLKEAIIQMRRIMNEARGSL